MPSPTNTDIHILQLIKNLDKQVIPIILEQYGDSLYGIAYRKLQRESLAVTAVQQTFVTVWQQLSGFNEAEDRIFNWILKIMNNIIANNYYQEAA